MIMHLTNKFVLFIELDIEPFVSIFGERLKTFVYEFTSKHSVSNI